MNTTRERPQRRSCDKVPEKTSDWDIFFPANIPAAFSSRYSYPGLRKYHAKWPICDEWITVAAARQLFVNRKIGYHSHRKSGGGNIDVAKEYGAVAVAQHSVADVAEVRQDVPARPPVISLADRAESGVQLLSRWAGILAFVGAVAAIAWLIF